MKLTEPTGSVFKQRATRAGRIALPCVAVLAVGITVFVVADKGVAVVSSDSNSFVNKETVEFYPLACQATGATQDASATVSKAVEKAVGEDPSTAIASLNNALEESAGRIQLLATILGTTPAPVVPIAGEIDARDWSAPRDDLAQSLASIADDLKWRTLPLPAPGGDLSAAAFQEAQFAASEAGMSGRSAFVDFVNYAPLPNTATVNAVKEDAQCVDLLADPTMSADEVDTAVVDLWSAHDQGTKNIRYALGLFSDIEGMDTSNTEAAAWQISTMFTSVATTTREAIGQVKKAAGTESNVHDALTDLGESWGRLAMDADKTAQRYLRLSQRADTAGFEKEVARLSDQLTALNVADAQASIRFSRLLPIRSEATAKEIEQRTTATPPHKSRHE